MKRRPSTVMTSLFLLGMLAGGALVWLLKGHLPGTTTTQQATQAIAVEQAKGSEAKAELATLKQSLVAKSEGAKETAMRLVQEVLSEEEPDWHGPKWYQFHNAVGQCDERALAEMLLKMKSASEGSPSKSLIVSQWCLPLVTRLATLNPRLALDYLVIFDGWNHSSTKNDFAAALDLMVQQNPQQLQEVIDVGPLGFMHIKIELAMLKFRAQTDPEGVFQDLMNRDAEMINAYKKQPPELASLLYALAVKAPEKALQLAPLFTSGGTAPYGDYRTTILEDWVGRDPKAARQWAMEQKDAGLLLECWSSNAEAFDAQQLRDHFLSFNAEPAEKRAELAGEIASKLAEEDVTASRLWAGTLPPRDQEFANFEIALQWIEKDAAAASEWLTTWPPGVFKDGAMESLTRAIVDDDPESALTWAVNIQQKNRYGLMRNALDKLTEKDPATAERAMLTLTEEDRAVLSVMKRTGLGE